jgi:hypothetical protein
VLGIHCLWNPVTSVAGFFARLQRHMRYSPAQAFRQSLLRSSLPVQSKIGFLCHHTTPLVVSLHTSIHAFHDYAVCKDAEPAAATAEASASAVFHSRVS